MSLKVVQALDHACEQSTGLPHQLGICSGSYYTHLKCLFLNFMISLSGRAAEKYDAAKYNPMAIININNNNNPTPFYKQVLVKQVKLYFFLSQSQM